MNQKSLTVPKCSRFTLDFPFSSLRAGGNIRRVRLLHMKDDINAFICGEKRITRNTFSNIVISRLFCTSTEPLYFNSSNSTMFFCSYYRTLRDISDPKCLVEYNEQDGTLRAMILCHNRVILLDPGLSSTFTAVLNSGGDCAAVHYERVFIGKGQLLHYSEPMKGDTLNQPSTYGYGKIQFTDKLGNILAIVSLRGKLYLFRQYGITAITAFADPLNFKIETVPYHCGKILTNTVAKCGDKVCFFTEKGLHVFDGTSCKRAVNADDEDINLTYAMSSAACLQDRYFIGVKLKSGEYIMYSYNPEAEVGRYLCYECFHVTSNATSMFFLCNDFKNQVFHFIGKSFGKNGECELQVDFTVGDKDKGEAYAECIAVKGEGEISLSLENKFGGKVIIAGKCGETLRLPRALRGGDYTLKIKPADTGFRIEGISFGMRRDFYDD